MRVKDQDKSNCDLAPIRKCLLIMALFWRESFGLDPKKNLKESSWFGERKCKLGFKVGHFYCFLLSLLFKLCENGRHVQ
jgi:hypothetical protein